MKVIWNLTRLCSWNCLICCVSAVHVNNKQKDDVHKKMMYSGKEISLSDKIKIIDDLAEFGVESIDFSGGDLLLRSDDIEIIEYAATKFSKKCLSASIPGTGLNSKVITRLKPCISKFEFTLDSIDEEKDGSRPKGYAGMAKNAIRVCKEEGIDVSVSTVLKKSNSSQQELSKVYNFLIENNVKEWEILRYYQVGRAIDIYGLNPERGELNKAIHYINELLKVGIVDISFQHSLENYINGVVKCNAVNRSIGILPDGTVNACAWGLGYDGTPANDKFVLGKLPEKKLKDIINGKKANEWIKNKSLENISVCQAELILKENSIDNEAGFFMANELSL